MIRPSRHDIPRSSVVRGQRASGDDLPRFAGSRFNSDDAYAGTKIANVLAVMAGAVILFFFLRSAFLAAVPAISRVIGGK
jgi:hypothetical protein